ncbi:MAG: amidohydrolase family protein [Acidimicrobiales bacterium]
MSTSRTAAQIRAELDHPVIDADGHWLEYGPVVRAELERIGGETAARAFLQFNEGVERSLSMSVAERRRDGLSQEAFWGSPTANTLDRATAMAPGLLYRRLEELGIDFSVIYPTMGLGAVRVSDDEGRRAACRAFNVFSAERFAPFADRLTPAAVIPMFTPEEALAELDHAVLELGLKAVMMGSLVPRPLEALADQPELARRFAWLDALGLDSAHDYDPVWARCVELGVAPTFHSGTRRYGLRTSPSNFVYNHIGHFAAAGEAVCKALFLGGVTRRFPTLNVAFLEGGVAWACLLYADLIGHWHKRSRPALEATNPANLDAALLMELISTHGEPDLVAALSERAGRLRGRADLVGGIADLDDYAACRLERAEEIRDLFVDRFYFGCEADDRMNAWAFDRARNAFGAELNAVFGSDIGHFDVLDMAGVLGEAFELVEDGLLDEAGFRRFTFENPARLWAQSNPEFFRGTAVERSVAELLAPAPAAG